MAPASHTGPPTTSSGNGLLRQVIGVHTYTRVDQGAARYEFLQRIDPDAHL